MAVLLTLLQKKNKHEADQYDQLPYQITLTHQWLQTKKHDRDNAEIKRDGKNVATARKREMVLKMSGSL